MSEPVRVPAWCDFLTLNECLYAALEKFTPCGCPEAAHPYQDATCVRCRLVDLINTVERNQAAARGD